MIDLLSTLARIAVAAPLPSAALLWWLAAHRARRVGAAMAWAGPVALLVVLWTQRRHLRGLVVALAVALLVVVWGALLLASPRLRWALAIALPAAAATGAWVALVGRWGHLPAPEALRTAMAEMRTAEVLAEAVPASAEGARVIRVGSTPTGEIEADVIGPPGMAHAELLASLRDTLAESVLSISGRPMASVSVIGNGAKGAVRVRCGVDRYADTLDIEELLA